MNRRRYSLWSLVLFLFPIITLSPAEATEGDPFAPVLNSPHHLAPSSASEKTTCAVCHTESDPPSQGTRPLWGTASSPYILSGRQKVRPVYAHQPTGPSLECLACHDGAVATDVHGIRTAAIGRPSVNQRIDGGGMRFDHPISVHYPRLPNGSIRPGNPGVTFERYWSIPDKVDGAIILPTGPTSPYLSFSASIANDYAARVPLVRTTLGEIQCDSCHTPHDPQVRPFLRTSPQSLCLICHDR